jgi:nicotinamidase-related amidase
MTEYNGTLLPAITTYRQSWPGRKFGLLVIDEQGNDRQAGELVNAMLETIAYADGAGFKIVEVEINPAMSMDRRQPTRAAFRAIIRNATVFFKKGFNAFGVIDASGSGKQVTRTDSSLLDAELRNAGVTELIVLGRMAGQCVRNTVIGGPEGTRQHPGPSLLGAVDFGYQVWTSPKILEGDGSAWTGGKGIKCYSHVS